MALVRSLKPNESISLEDLGVEIINGGSHACRLIVKRDKPYLQNNLKSQQETKNEKKTTTKE